MTIVYTIGNPFTERESLCDLYKEGYFYDYDGERVFVKVGYIGYNGVFHPTHLFIHKQITESGNYKFPETVELANNRCFEVYEFTIRKEM